MQRGKSDPSKPIGKLLYTHTLGMTRRGRSILGKIADREDRHKLIIRHLGEKLLELRRIEMRDPRRPKSQVFNRQHHMRRRNARIDIGEIFLVKGTYPSIIRLAAHKTKTTGAPKMKDVVCETFSIASALSRSQI